MSDQVLVIGGLTIRGVTKGVDLKTDLLGAGPDSRGGCRSGFEGRTKTGG
ncbi:MAG: hypothetical protein HYX75_03990 [Acidobacteria bacterium]|nr:hypothetical protein [Acidobacteriota bacterium]